ncbi:Trm112 family protein [Undibacterium sp. Ji50W]|uniref:Trm112 family protein n=1 Tax=Undibacterium TaxID=401469 RepID=UPI003BF0FB37
MDARLLDVLVCPLCKGPLVYHKASQELICYGDRLAFQIRDDIPIMWADQARALTPEEVSARV